MTRASPVRRGERRVPHPAVAQHGHVIDGVRPGHHSGDQGHDFEPGIRALVRGHAQPLVGQAPQARFLGSFIAGTKPAEDTRLESSNDADTARVVCETCIYEMPSFSVK